MIARQDAQPPTRGPVTPALLTPAQASTYVGMSRRWVYRALSAGEFPRPVKVGRSTRWRRADLDQWIAEL
jgi:excisionase family DNA binding protein